MTGGQTQRGEPVPSHGRPHRAHNPAWRECRRRSDARERVIAMPDSTRRNFLIATGAGAAAVGVATALPGSAAALSGSAERKATLPSGAEPLIAHVADPRS